MDPMILRAIERILAVAIGGLSICLGYRLFLAVPRQRDGSGSVKLPWNISVALARVGPGVFFALYGAVVVGYSLHGAIHMVERVEQGPNGQPVTLRESHALGAVAAAPGSGDSLAGRRLRGAGQVEFLNTLGQFLRQDIDPAERRAIQRQVTALKLAIMAPLWADDWGSESALRDWAEGQRQYPLPRESDAAAQFFRIGEEDSQ